MKILYDPTDKEDFGRLTSMPAALNRQIIAGLSPAYKIYHFGEVLKQEYRCPYFYLYFLQLTVTKTGYIHLKWDKQVHLLQYAFKASPATPFKDGPGILIKEGMSRIELIKKPPTSIFLDAGDYKHLFIELENAYWKSLCKQLPHLTDLLITRGKVQKSSAIPIDYEVMDIIRKLRESTVFNEEQQIYFLSLVRRLIDCYAEGVLEQRRIQELPDIPHKAVLTSIRNNILYEPNVKYHRINPLTREYLLSKGVLSNGFHGLYDISITNFVQKTCMDKAFLLLTTTDMSITAIAQDIGYSFEKDFARAFKKWHGISPLKLRQQHPDSP